uniref:Uncharacterized protein n=1 Tax=viral metagenome TaxID=1070528 RepID=A0A6M3XZT0_9ZZZZ
MKQLLMAVICLLLILPNIPGMIHGMWLSYFASGACLLAAIVCLMLAIKTIGGKYGWRN